MNQTLNSSSGQSNYDICISCIGSLDGYINFLNKNNIESDKEIIKTYNFDSNDILNKSFSGYKYATNSEIFFNENKEIVLVTEDDLYVISKEDNSAYIIKENDNS